jgi:hydrogenase/urease accessory protein HupE
MRPAPAASTTNTISGQLTFALTLFAFLAGPSLADAHLVTTGMGPVYDGIGHFVMTPEDFVPVLALALYAGLRGAVSGRTVMFLLPLAWFSGGLAGSMIRGIPAFPLPIISFLVLGALVAADLHMKNKMVAVLAVCLGLAHGFLNGEALREGPGTLGILGITAMLFVLSTLVSAFVTSLKKPWSRIAVRVAGSWIFASGILMFGWLFRGVK